jgi:hypothetical protein
MTNGYAASFLLGIGGSVAGMLLFWLMPRVGDEPSPQPKSQSINI